MAVSLRKNPYMDICKTISENLTAWMDRNPSLDTIQKLEAKSGVGFGTIRRAKNGDGNITVEKLTAIAAAFGRSPADLVTPARQYPMAGEHAATVKPAGEPVAPQWKTVRSERIAAINALLAQTDDYGLVAVLEKAKDIARDYPVAKPKTVS